MSDELYNAVVETMQEGLLVVDTGGQILAVNPAFEAMTGYACGELVGKPCTVLNCTGCKILRQQGEGGWCMLFVKQSVRNRRCEMVAKDGRNVQVLKSATILHDHAGKISGAVETLRDISEVVRQEEKLRALRSSLCLHTSLCGIVGSSRPVQQLLDMIENVAQSDAPVLVYGESGVGKELVARSVHECGPRSEGNFIKVNCASLNENLLESELFGHVKGAFTGAARDRIGRFEAASGGSIFLDEIGDISPAMQVKLLRVLESKEIERVGDHRSIPVDARIIAATNRSLEQLVALGQFREDLFYRISVVPVTVPPLREHNEDIPLLAQTFIDKIAQQSGKPINGLSSEALEWLFAYEWPGNVRELRNAIEYAFVLCRGGLIQPEHLPPRISPIVARDQIIHCQVPNAENGGESAGSHPPEVERLIQALRETGGNQTAAARLLGISRVAVWKRMKKYGITLEKNFLR